LNRRFPNTELGWFALGLYYEECGEAEKSIEPYKKAAEFHGSLRPLALLGLGGRYFDLGEYDLAIEVFQRLLSEYENKMIEEDIAAEAKWYIGKSFEHKLDYPSAIRSYLSIVESVSSSTKSWCWYRGAKFRIGYCYLQMGDCKKAFEIWREATTEIPSQEYEHKLFKRILEEFENLIKPLPPSHYLGKKGSLRMLGPIAGLFLDFKVDHAKKGTLIIYGSRSLTELDNIHLKNTGFLLQQKIKAGDYLFPYKYIFPCKADRDVPVNEIKENNLILIGTPKSNSVLAFISDSLPIKIGDEFIQIANRIYTGRDKGVIMIAPNPLNKNKYVLVLSAFDTSIIEDIIVLQHGLTDYIIFSANSVAKEYRFLEEGYFFKTIDDKWEPFYSHNSELFQRR